MLIDPVLFAAISLHNQSSANEELKFAPDVLSTNRIFQGNVKVLGKLDYGVFKRFELRGTLYLNLHVITYSM